MYQPIQNEIFHVHTARCGHAGVEAEYEYVEKAIELGAKRIVFTDHCPFTGDAFRGRMRMDELPDYILTMKHLRKEYASAIEVMSGLEVEYLPSYKSYYKELKNTGDMDLLIIGQHMYECESGMWSYMLEDKTEEYKGLCSAICEAVNLGLFDVVAHPDRIFRRNKKWSNELLQASRTIIETTRKNGIWIEKNYSSMQRKHFFREEFWKEISENKILYGYDAHSVSEMEEIWNKIH